VWNERPLILADKRIHTIRTREESSRIVDVALTHRVGGSEIREEREHELRAALFGIEASAEGLSRHRQLLTDQQLDALTSGLAHEVRRVRMLLEERSNPEHTFDLGEAIEPVVACMRATGVDVRCSVPRGIAVIGNRYRTAQVVLGLLDNARQHAPLSPVEIRTRELCGAVALYVEDRGSGVPEERRDGVFERGQCGVDSAGSGLGLYVARCVMAEQGGSIVVRSRPGGGATFVLHFTRPPDTAECVYRGVRYRCRGAR
jgi:signal transduction histidine kinase